MRWKPHVRFGGRAGETDRWKHRHGAPARSHLANSKLDEVRRRVQNETFGHRGRKPDPLYRARKLLVMAEERVIDVDGRERLLGLLAAGDPKGEVRTAWHAKELVRSVYDHSNAELALEFVDRLGHDLQHESCPPEIHQLGRTIRRWKQQIAAWHQAHLSNGPTEAANNLIKRINASGSASPASATTASAFCSTPADPTGSSYRQSLPAEIRRAPNRLQLSRDTGGWSARQCGHCVPGRGTTPA